MALGERCQLAKSDRDAKKRELSDIAGKVPSLEVAVREKEKDLQKSLLDFANTERLRACSQQGQLTESSGG